MVVEFSSEVTGLAGNLGRGDVLEFRFDSPRVISVRLGKSYPDGRKPREASDAVCTNTTTVEPPDPKIAAELKSGWVLPVVAGKVKVGDPTTEFIDSVFAELRSLMKSTVTLFRWRQGIAEGPPDPCHTLGARYSEDGDVWHDVSLLRSVSLHFGMTGPSAPDDDACKQVAELVTVVSEEPLGRQLFREAWIQRNLRPRSAWCSELLRQKWGSRNWWAAWCPRPNG